MNSLRKKILSFYTILLIVFSPLSLLSLYTVVKCSFPKQPEDAFATVLPSKSEKKNTPNNNIYILLFDEMSYEYLYTNKLINKKYPNIQSLASTSDNYHSAFAPGQDTLISIPQLLLGKNGLEIKVAGNNIFSVNEKKKLTSLKEYPENIFSIANNKGYYTSLYGWYLQYDKIIGDIADECISLSMYNHSSLMSNFSIFDPILTTIFIWPEQYPFGLFKKPLYASFHRNNVEKLFSLGFAALSRSEPSFIFLHVPIPHNPFVYDIMGFKNLPDPFEETNENYIHQLDYVDRLVGKFMKELKSRGKFNNSIIILMSDHNFRRKVEKNKRSKIPFIIKREGQNKSRDFYETVAATDLIKDLLDDSND